MTLQTIKDGSCTFPVLKNDRKVQAMAQLQFYKEATEAVALAGAEVVEDKDEGDDNPEVAKAPPAKKLKRNKVRSGRRHGRKRDELAAASDAMEFRRSCIHTLRQLMPWLSPDIVARVLLYHSASLTHCIV